MNIRYKYKNINQGFRYRIHYQLETLKEGKGEIYIYDDGDHLYTIKINSFHVKPITLENTTLKVKQGESISTKILQGGGKYRKYSDYQPLAHFDIDSDKDENGLYLSTGEVNVRHSEVGRYYPVISDRYNQLKRLKVIIQDADLRLSQYVPSNLKVGEWYRISVLDRYQSITKIEQTKGDKILQYRYIRERASGSEYIEIKGLQSGNTVLRAWDAEGNYDTVDVTVGNGESEESSGGEQGDGSENEESETGSSHEVSHSEFDTLLKELFAEFGIESVEGVEVNNSFSLTKESKNNIDIRISQLIRTKGKDKILKLKTAIPQAKKKWTSQRHHAILNYLSESIEKQLEILVIHSIEDINNGNIGGLEFEVAPNLHGKISNIGVSFINELGQREKQELKIRDDGKYIVAFSQDSCNGCKELVPYYLISGRTDEIFAYTGDDIEVANSMYQQFKTILTNIWYWKGYDKEYERGVQKVVDIKEDVKGQAINLILQQIAEEASGGVDIGRVNIDTLPIAGYMLNKFLNGPSNNEIYDTDHWISQKIKHSEDYNNILALIESQGYTYHDLEEGEEREFISSSSSFDAEFFPISKLDLLMAIHSYRYSLSVYKEDGIFYTKIKFSDEYDFEPAKYGNGITDTLNYLGNYHEKNLTGTPYKWESIIVDKLN